VSYIGGVAPRLAMKEAKSSLIRPAFGVMKRLRWQWRGVKPLPLTAFIARRISVSGTGADYTDFRNRAISLVGI
jgi:hypothetical protein